MRVALAVALFAVTMGAGPVAAQFYPPPYAGDRRGERDIGWQLDEIYETIEEARRSGRFSEPEARALHREGQRLFEDFRYMRADGLDGREFYVLDQRTRALRDRLERRLRFGDWRDQRDDGFRDGRRWEDGEWRGDEDWGRDDPRRRWPDQERNRDTGREDVWLQGEKDEAESEEPWRDEPVGDPGQWDEDWAAPAAEDRDAPASDRAPADDWWLPPEERETIETRPGDRPPDIGNDGG